MPVISAEVVEEDLKFVSLAEIEIARLMCCSTKHPRKVVVVSDFDVIVCKCLVAKMTGCLFLELFFIIFRHIKFLEIEELVFELFLQH